MGWITEHGAYVSINLRLKYLWIGSIFNGTLLLQNGLFVYFKLLYLLVLRKDNHNGIEYFFY